MTFVYVVTKGSYSDYRICAVFSTEELAEQYVKELNEPEADVEPWALDEEVGFVDRQVFSAAVIIETGELIRHPVSHEMASPNERLKDVNYHEGTSAWPSRASAKSYVSQEHADKVAVEQRQMILRQRQEHASLGDSQL